MNILMMTNTYKPLVGGLEKSVENFSNEFRTAGHRVIIVAPEFEGMQPEEDVIRIPAVQHFNGSDFSIHLPIPGVLEQGLGDFKPDIVHTHHPFLLGDTALRLASKFNVPLVFTHHTLYEQNVHYVPGNQEALKRFVIELSTGYANLADQVFAPSESVLNLMRERGVLQTPIEVVPTGIYLEDFSRGAGKAFRRKLGIPDDAFVVGCLGRLAPEKNLEFLTRAVVQFLKKQPKAHFLVCGSGPLAEMIEMIAKENAVSERLHMGGVVKGKALKNAYAAMDVFAFASQSETQGLVVTESMAARTPVIAVDAPGVREVVEDGINGRLLPHESLEDFVSALEWMSALPVSKSRVLKTAARKTAERFSMHNCAQKALAKYTELSIRQGFTRRPEEEENAWKANMRFIHAQWDIVKNLTKAAGALIAVGAVGLGADEEPVEMQLML